jgi:hypothetical protein
VTDRVYDLDESIICEACNATSVIHVSLSLNAETSLERHTAYRISRWLKWWRIKVCNLDDPTFCYDSNAASVFNVGLLLNV